MGGGFCENGFYLWTDRELWQEALWAEENVEDEKVPGPDPGEFERIWERIKRERGDRGA